MTDFHYSHSDGESARRGLFSNICTNNECGLPVKLWEQIERLRAKLATFNTAWPHDPPEVGDTKWVRLRWIGRQQSRIEEGKCDE
ncbi:MAG: hypothetical protein FJ276_35015 [Planctomycetes bacterium]|nr:hypothetical protein [Planctomycetota bacterium]